MSRPVHFEIHAADPEAVAKFYEGVFGWEIKKWDGPADYWLITTGPDDQDGINGAIMRRQGDDPDPNEPTPVVGYVNTVGVGSLDETQEKALAQGAVVALPKMAVPGIGWLVYLKDPAANIFGVLQPDENAQ